MRTHTSFGTVLRQLVRFTLATLLLYAGIGKLLDPSATRAFVAALIHWNPPTAAVYIAAITECALAFCLIVVVSKRPLLITSSVFTVFTVMHVLSLEIEGGASCGCLGAGTESLPPTAMAGLCAAVATCSALTGVGGAPARPHATNTDAGPQPEPVP
ncbi:MAG: MauE/DoxX family redox-associated membrane protein [Phycisphaerales bacterium]